MTEVGCWDAYASKKKWTLHDCWKKPNRIFTRMTMIENLIFPRIFAHRAKDRSQLFGWYRPITIPEHHHGELVVILAVYLYIISIYHLSINWQYQEAQRAFNLKLGHPGNYDGDDFVIFTLVFSLIWSLRIIFSLVKHLKHFHVQFQLLSGYLLLHLPDIKGVITVAKIKVLNFTFPSLLKDRWYKVPCSQSNSMTFQIWTFKRITLTTSHFCVWRR